jgi:HNH endonuclease
MILYLTQGYQAEIDEADWARVSIRRWHVHFNRGGSPYARASIGGWKVYLGRFLLEPPKDMDVDHINGNTLDYRRANLEIVTPLENIHRRDLRRADKLAAFRGINVDTVKLHSVEEIPF